jgi:hypothetical protein
MRAGADTRVGSADAPDRSVHLLQTVCHAGLTVVVVLITMADQAIRDPDGSSGAGLSLSERWF